MQILGINGSHRKGRNTARLLQIALDAAAELGAETKALEITDYNIQYCKGCNKCMRQAKCSIEDDDMAMLGEMMIEADGIILASPTYFGGVSGRMKTFIDRTRWMHMTKNLLQGKVGGILVHAGLRHGGQEMVLVFLERFLVKQGLIVVPGMEPIADVPPERTLISSGGLSTLYSGYGPDGLQWYRSVEDDPVAVQSARLVGQNMVQMLQRLGVK